MGELIGTLDQIRDQLRVFASERDWEKFHSPKNLAAALCVEAAELLEPFQWLQTGELSELGDAKLQEVKHELADVLMLSVRLADRLGINLLEAVAEKLEQNRKKYPPAVVRGSSKKYDEY